MKWQELNPEAHLFELHDAFSIMAALSLEACGFADAAGPRLGLDNEITLTGRLPSAPAAD